MLFFGLDNNQLNSNSSYLNILEDISKITHAETRNIEETETVTIELKLRKTKSINENTCIIQKIQKSRHNKYKKLIRKLAKLEEKK